MNPIRVTPLRRRHPKPALDTPAHGRRNRLYHHQPGYKAATVKRVLPPMLAAAALLLVSPAFAPPAMATTSTPVSMTLVEAVAPGASAGCTVLENGTGLCGRGQVIPYGQATEIVLFSGCGDNCFVHTITLAGGEITFTTTQSSPDCPGACQPNPGDPFSAALAAVVVGGTGQFTGASGTLTGSVTHAGAVAVVMLSGTITLP